jgi:uncharacterized membrane protein (UPF0127 family)
MATRECWLVSDGHVLASAERAESRHDRGKGLLGRDRIEGALVLDRTRWVHTLGMKFAIDVAYIGGDGVVLKITHMRRFRVGAPVRAAAMVVEAADGAFERWGLKVGDPVELRE